MQVFVRNLQGTVQTIDLSDDTLSSDICPLTCLLVHNGCPLKPSIPLVQQGIREHFTLTMSVALRGGGSQEKVLPCNVYG